MKKKHLFIILINGKNISELNKSEICEFLNEKYKTYDVIFN